MILLYKRKKGKNSFAGAVAIVVLKIMKEKKYYNKRRIDRNP